MSKILVINCGSSSVKYQLFNNKFKVLQKGLKEIRTEKADKMAYAKAFNEIVYELLKSKFIKNLDEIIAVGHRVVHGGEKFSKPVVINNVIIKELKKLCELAPLHNPANIEGILECKKLFPKAKQIAVFDTAYYSTLPEKAYLYALPYNLYTKQKIRRYGFHGTNHEYVVNEALKLMKTKKAKIVSCHMGNGISITASINGKAIDTSMGFTPLEGVPMGTRSGDIDPAIILHLIKTGIKPEKIDYILNHESGLKGLFGKSHMKDIWEASQKNNKRAKLTIEILAYRIAKYIGSYTAAMNGLDALIFTAGMGEKAWYLREIICEYLAYLGVEIDKKKNKTNKDLMICDKKSEQYIFVIPANEELAIAKHCQ